MHRSGELVFCLVVMVRTLQNRRKQPFFVEILCHGLNLYNLFAGYNCLAPRKYFRDPAKLPSRQRPCRPNAQETHGGVTSVYRSKAVAPGNCCSVV
jgi:hypothetical protein